MASHGDVCSLDVPAQCQMASLRAGNRESSGDNASRRHATARRFQGKALHLREIRAILSRLQTLDFSPSDTCCFASNARYAASHDPFQLHTLASTGMMLLSFYYKIAKTDHFYKGMHILFCAWCHFPGTCHIAASLIGSI